MGSFTSKQLDETLKSPKSQDTPKSVILPFDPRSPSEEITRTPIAVSNKEENSSVESTPRDGKVVRVLELDPRSPIIEVNRTPIVVESNETRRRHHALKPSRLAQVDTENQNIDADSTDQDPRSPTIKVPRTPLEDKEHVFENSETLKENGENNDGKAYESEDDENCQKDQENGLVKKLFADDASTEKLRRPLASVQNTTANKTPRGLIQAKQCRNVEEEYNKNHQLILTQLSDQENVVSSSTQFVESI